MKRKVHNTPFVGNKNYSVGSWISDIFNFNLHKAAEREHEMNKHYLEANSQREDKEISINKYLEELESETTITLAVIITIGLVLLKRK